MVRNPDALMWVALREEHHHLWARVAGAVSRRLCTAIWFPACRAPRSWDNRAAARSARRAPRALLEKQGRLTPEEFEQVKAHVALGLEVLSATPNWPEEVTEGIAQHHERMNGSGYPQGLRAEAIGIFGRMAGIADCFAALTKSRPYAEAVSSYEALRSITGWGGEILHAPLAEQFVQAVGVFPVGPWAGALDGRVAVISPTRCAG
jgi:hypothetical protein